MEATAAGGTAAAGVGAIGGATGTDGRAAALAGAIGRVAAALGPAVADALGVEVSQGEGRSDAPAAGRMSPMSLRHCLAWRRSNLSGRGEF